MFIGTISWIFIFTNTFMSELSMMACTIATLYHLKKCQWFVSFKHTVIVALWFALGVLSRPVEYTAAFVFPMIGFVIVALIKKAIRFRDLLCSLPFGLLTLGLFVLSLSGKLSRLKLVAIFLLAVVVFLIPLLNSKKWKLYFPYQLAFYLANTLILFWWFPFMRRFYEWIIIPTGVTATRYHDVGQMVLFQAIPSFFVNVGGFPLLFLAILSIFTCLLGVKYWKQIAGSYFFYSLVAITMILPPIVLLSMTPDIAYRRAFCGFSFLFLINAIFAVHSRAILSRIRLLLVLLFVGAQIFVIFIYTFDWLPATRGKLLPYFSRVGFTLRGGDPSTATFEELKKLKIGNSRLAIFSLAMNNYEERPFDPSGLNVLNARDPGKVNPKAYPGAFDTLEEGYAQLRTNWDYCIVDVTTPPPVNPLYANSPYNRLTADIIARWKANQLDEVQLKYVTEFEIAKTYLANQKQRTLKKIVVLMIQNGGEPRLSFLENAALASRGAVAGCTTRTEAGTTGNINDGNDDLAWGAWGTTEDTIFYITLPQPAVCEMFKVITFATPAGEHIRDLTVVATSEVPSATAKWIPIRSRIGSQGEYSEKMTIPNLPNQSVITIELDPADSKEAYRTFGLACFSKSKGYARNYLGQQGNGIYIRDLQMKIRKAGENAQQTPL
jgi:hypothetical protein